MLVPKLTGPGMAPNAKTADPSTGLHLTKQLAAWPLDDSDSLSEGKTHGDKLVLDE